MGKSRVVDRDGVMGRRGFLWRGVGMGSAVVLRPYWASCGAAARDERDGRNERVLDRDAVTRRLRPGIRRLLHEMEEKTGLSVEFQGLGRRFGVIAQYRFDQPDRPIVQLRGDWGDEDVAHELMHMKLELVEGYSVLAWLKNVVREKVVERAFGLIRSYTDDILVFERLAGSTGGSGRSEGAVDLVVPGQTRFGGYVIDACVEEIEHGERDKLMRQADSDVKYRYEE